MLTQNIVNNRIKHFIESTSKNTFKIIYEDGTIIDYHLSFNYDIEGNLLSKNNDNPLMKIPNYSHFIIKLTTLLNLMENYHRTDKDYFDFSNINFIDYLIVCAFSNMNEYDLNNPITYLDRLIESYTFPYNFEKQKIGQIIIKEKKIDIYKTCNKNLASMEAPLHQKLFFEYEGQCFYLPKIHYYVSHNTCYIMAIQNSKKKQDNNLAKLLDRYFRKMDKGLENIERSSDGKINTPKDISPSALAALTLFISHNNLYPNFCLPSFLPLRYINKEGSLNAKNENIEEAERIQANLTNKLLFTGMRLCEHFKFSTYDLEDNGFLKIKFNPCFTNNENIIFDLYNSINNKENHTKIENKKK